MRHLLTAPSIITETKRRRVDVVCGLIRDCLKLQPEDRLPARELLSRISDEDVKDIKQLDIASIDKGGKVEEHKEAFDGFLDAVLGGGPPGADGDETEEPEGSHDDDEKDDNYDNEGDDDQPDDSVPETEKKDNEGEKKKRNKGILETTAEILQLGPLDMDADDFAWEGRSERRLVREGRRLYDLALLDIWASLARLLDLPDPALPATTRDVLAASVENAIKVTNLLLVRSLKHWFFKFVFMCAVCVCVRELSHVSPICLCVRCTAVSTRLGPV